MATTYGTGLTYEVIKDDGEAVIGSGTWGAFSVHARTSQDKEDCITRSTTY